MVFYKVGKSFHHLRRKYSQNIVLSQDEKHTFHNSENFHDLPYLLHEIHKIQNIQNGPVRFTHMYYTASAWEKAGTSVNQKWS